MEQFDVHILGCGSAKPSARHKPSAQVVNIRGKLFMIDCGEAAQVGFARQGLNINRLGHVFISHNHGDHIFGLPGFISTMGLLGRTATLHIYGPEETRRLLNVTLQTYCTNLDYAVEFHPVDTTRHSLIYEDRSVEVWSIPLAHRVPCCGFHFKEKPGLPHIRREMIDFYGIPLAQINNIKAGASWTTADGTIVPHERLTTPADPPRSYAYCSDTSYLPDLAETLRHTTLLYHEATYPAEFESHATKYGHTTAPQAAQLALDAEVGKLCLGHFSARIKDETAYLAEATAIFPNTVLADERLILHV